MAISRSRCNRYFFLSVAIGNYLKILGQKKNQHLGLILSNQNLFY